VLRDFGGAQFSVFKPALADLAVSVLSPINQRMRDLMADPGHIDAILGDGAERANAIAETVIAEVGDIVGFLSSRRRG
jgi:tryptophanyl-tRNA synthetase